MPFALFALSRRLPAVHGKGILRVWPMLLGSLLATATVQAAPSSTAPSAQPASPPTIAPRTDGLPRELQEWVPWAMQGHEMLACPSRHDQAGSRA